MYTPDEWQIVKILGTDPHYRVFGSWRGGYLDGDSWRLNSGIKKIEKVDNGWELIGYSGSVYKVFETNYGIRSPYNAGELSRICTPGLSEILEEMPDMGLLLENI